MKLHAFLTACLLLTLSACGSGPGVAPEPPTSPEHYNGDLPQGTSNDVYHGGR